MLNLVLAIFLRHVSLLEANRTTSRKEFNEHSVLLRKRGIIIECKIGGQHSPAINVSLKVPDSCLESEIHFNSLPKENAF